VIVLDASALIAFLDPSTAQHSTAVASVLACGAHGLAVSPITHAEVLVGPTRAGTLATTQQALAALRVSEVALPDDGAPRLAALRADTRLKLPDCCVILAAQQSGGALLTFDRRLTAVARELDVAVQEPADACDLAS
jgi:predicted nucleic acid-binding protein